MTELENLGLYLNEGTVSACFCIESLVDGKTIQRAGREIVE
jgi:hypothetical protein